MVQNIFMKNIKGLQELRNMNIYLMHYENLHWLPIECRIKFKILLMVYKSLNGLAPDYLFALIYVRRPTRSLRSPDKLLLNVPKINTVTYGQRAFSYVAATLWNSIPDYIKNSVTVEIFKTSLK